ncbi:hypothetical protein THAOC_24581 [Thalassiosira oceanica]|uniref:Uncharacterized protein n=1 Tax=Thalassiosira oceanica TaxID=159749 RepID=K0RRN2_THAOC|nr:hypothetical protein THAOC_24581 [Thalassiosira oceanica]|eukprot:EJK55660.1 hypothetical protein THAOC_24581 [Thalassiosira oceanica]
MKLQGIVATREVRSSLTDILELPQPHASSSAPACSARAELSTAADASSPSAIQARVLQTKHDKQNSPSSVEEARSMLKTCTGGSTLPLECIQALRYLIQMSQTTQQRKSEQLKSLDAALRGSRLVFETPQKKAADPTYQKRLERLRLKSEERMYSKLTTNLQQTVRDDDVTAKSMTYATSIGLNMVVAPISFGVFMYFFAGSIFSRFFDEQDDVGGNIDIRRVIAGVVSGVFMLFVEMILFVIRSHEIDASVRKKSKRKEYQANPFGYTTKHAERTWTKEMLEKAD